MRLVRGSDTSLFIRLIDLSTRGKVIPETVSLGSLEPRGGNSMKVASSSIIALIFSSFSVMIQSIFPGARYTSFVNALYVSH